jgi:NTP pyrophosphatase (non-canonical NTP hydrolase)
MNVAELQRSVRDFVAAHGLEASAEVRLLDLLSELGELAKEALEASDYGRQAFAPTPDWQGELGDALFSLVCLANETGVDMEQALHGALRKYERRLAARGDAGSGR